MKIFVSLLLFFLQYSGCMLILSNNFYKFSGIAMLYLQFPAGQPKGKELCCELLELSRKHSKAEKIAFLCGSSGNFCWVNHTFDFHKDKGYHMS